MAIAPSLFGASPAPVLPAASDWITGTFFGDLATSLCVLAVAFIGFRLMMGQMAVRDGLRVIIGCFVLLGAPAIASGLLTVAGEPDAPGRAVVTTTVLPDVPSRPYDPYLGASINWTGSQQQPLRDPTPLPTE